MIRILFMDVDGTLTDGKIVFGSHGEMCKAFNVKDGYGISTLLPENGIIPAIITGRCSEIVKWRAKELGIDELYQGEKKKLEVLYRILNQYSINSEDAAYIGDDDPDIPCMQVCGICGCPSDASDRVKKVCDYVCKTCGGHGAVREFIEYLLQEKDTK